MEQVEKKYKINNCILLSVSGNQNKTNAYFCLKNNFEKNNSFLALPIYLFLNLPVAFNKN